MSCLVVAHDGDNGPAFRIFPRQTLKMSLKVVLNLAFRFDQESHAPFVSRQSGNHTKRKGARIPGGIEHADAGAQGVKPMLAPSQVIPLFRRSNFQRLANIRLSRHQCLSLVERLGTHLTSVVDPHKACRLNLFSL